MGAINKAGNDFERTGEDTVAMLQERPIMSRTFFAVESDGTIVPVPDYMDKHVKYDNYIAFSK